MKRILLVEPRWKVGRDNFLEQIDMTNTFTRLIDIPAAASGTKFIKENVPGVELLEYPSTQEFKSALLQDYDVVALSFRTYQLPDAIGMAKIAQEYGVPEVWGGGWGSMTPGVNRHFDRVIIGPGENAMREILGFKPLPYFHHPIFINKGRILFKRVKVGCLFTARGCNKGCRYCASPRFIRGRIFTPIEEIKRVLNIYQKEGVKYVLIYDENFSLDEDRVWTVINLLSERDLLWFCLTRADDLLGRVERLRNKGFIGALTGIESLRDENLRSWRKHEKSDQIVQMIKEMNDNCCYTLGTYIFCAENDTLKSMREDIERLSSLEIPSVMPCILTPFPGTPLFEKFKSRIIDWNWRHWDDGHLVWNHPDVSPRQAQDILFECAKTCNSMFGNIIFILKLLTLRRIMRW
ncbi:MAG: B12-binding domain-containing radical SAM protein [Promethearchaeota archaeon]